MATLLKGQCQGAFQPLTINSKITAILGLLSWHGVFGKPVFPTRHSSSNPPLYSMQIQALILNRISSCEVQLFDLTSHKLSLLWLLQTPEPFYISGSECLKFMCEFCISKYSDSHPRGNQLFQKYALLTDLKKLNAIHVLN